MMTSRHHKSKNDPFADDYVSTLDAANILAAEKLNEYPSDRAAAIRSFREWIYLNRKWLSTPTDSHFLLSFLRMRKFSQAMARKSLVKYWQARTDYPQWFSNVDTQEEAIQNVLDNGSYLTLPDKDKLGRRVLLGRPGVVDPSGRHYNSNDVIKTGFALSEYFLMDEATQVNGFVVLMDFTGMTMKHQSFHGMQNLKKNANIMSKVYPIRTQEVHNYNMGKVGDAILSVTKKFLPTKVQQRIYNHSTLVSVYEKIDQHLLPEEYLPDDYDGPNVGPIDKHVVSLREEMASARVHDHILKLSSGQYGINVETKPLENEIRFESYRKIIM